MSDFDDNDTVSYEGHLASLASKDAEIRALRDALENLQNDYCNNECERAPDHLDLCIQARAALSTPAPASATVSEGSACISVKHADTDCRSEEGITVGLIDAIINSSRLVVRREWSGVAVEEALKDLRSDVDVAKVMKNVLPAPEQKDQHNGWQKAAIPEGLADLCQAAKLHEYGKISLPASTVLALIERISRLESDAGVLSCGHPAAMWEEVGYADYCGVCKLEAENAALRSTVASLLSIDDSKISDYVVLDAEALKAAAGNRVAELEAKVAALQWRPITPETPWEEATEIATYFDDPTYFFHTEWPQSVPGAESMFGAYWLRKGYTWFRRLNPPAQKQPVAAQKGKQP